MTRALLIVLDSVGCGAAADAADYGDVGADTLGHIASACDEGRGDRTGLRAGPLRLPNLDRLGLRAAHAASTGGLASGPAPAGQWGYAIETSRGKDTPSGHWELAGTPVVEPWGYFPTTPPTFPPDLVAALVARAGLPGVLGLCHASGTAIIDALGAEHVAGGAPIVYTSVDSVLQIAAHEEAFGLARLLDACLVARALCDPLRIGRVIARPFVGDAASGFRRTAGRRDFAMPPPPGTILQRAVEAGRAVVTVGKLGDIFAHRFTGEERKGAGNEANVALTLDALAHLPDGGLVFANYVDFDSEYGHRRDVAGYAAALEAFDARLPAIEALLRPGDLVVVTADHGNDPTFRGSDHTREHVPVLAFGPGVPAGPIGRRGTFADVGATLAAHLGLPASGPGTAWRTRWRGEAHGATPARARAGEEPWKA